MAERWELIFEGFILGCWAMMAAKYFDEWIKSRTVQVPSIKEEYEEKLRKMPPVTTTSNTEERA